MNLIEKINAISKEAKNQFKPDLIKYGKNFRAISESAVLDVLSPLLEKYKVAYSVSIKKSEVRHIPILCGSDNNGNQIQQFIFEAICEVALVLNDAEDISALIMFEGLGMGIDYGDKATGKAITAAVKYALFKGFRLQYSDDPDAEESKPIESVVDSKKKSAPDKEEPLVSEKMLNYIKGLCVSLGISDEQFKKQYKFAPYDAKMPMRVAREAIDKLKAEAADKLPF